MTRQLSTKRSDYRTIEITSVVRKDGAEQIAKVIFDSLGGDGVTVCDLNCGVRDLTDDEWKQFDELVDICTDNKEEE